MCIYSSRSFDSKQAKEFVLSSGTVYVSDFIPASTHATVRVNNPNGSQNYWVSAIEYCKSIGMSLPSNSILTELHDKYRGQQGLATGDPWLWTSEGCINTWDGPFGYMCPNNFIWSKTGAKMSTNYQSENLGVHAYCVNRF